MRDYRLTATDHLDVNRNRLVALIDMGEEELADMEYDRLLNPEDQVEWDFEEDDE